MRTYNILIEDIDKRILEKLLAIFGPKYLKVLTTQDMLLRGVDREYLQELRRRSGARSTGELLNYAFTVLDDQLPDRPPSSIKHPNNASDNNVTRLPAHIAKGTLSTHQKNAQPARILSFRKST